jgi:DNA-binding CsgD family transcriptional regulator
MAYHRANKTDSAVYYLEMAVDMARKYKMLREEKMAEETLYKVYKGEKKFAEALRSFERCSALNDSINSIGIKEKIAELNSKYEAEIKDQKIRQLLLDEKINQAKTSTYIISLILFSVIVILAAAFLFSKKRTQTRLLTVKSKLLEKEKAELDKELEFKKKQLTSHALHMTQKNKILQSIRKAVNEVLPEIPENTREHIRALQMELNKSLRYDKDWEVFSMYFNELNKDFFDKLTSINPDLSQYDLRLAALLRMNMNIKEAAAVLNIEPDSVKTARYKLRKKLGLKAEDDLVRYIMNIA